MLYRYGTFVARRPRTLLAIAGLIMIAALVVGVGAFGKLKGGGFDDPAAESTRAQQLIDSRFGGEANLALLVTAQHGTVDDQGAAAAGRAVTDRLRSQADVSDVVSYWSTGSRAMRSHDGRQAIVLAHVDGTDDQVLTRTKAFIPTLTTDTGPVSVTAGGAAGANVDVTGQVTRSLAIAEAIAVPVTMLLLVLAFGSVVAALLPLAIGGIAILGTFAELFVLGSVTSVSVFAINLTTALGLGLGIDYALFMVSRFREQLSAGEPPPLAVARTVATAGRTIVFSAATVAAALAALLVFPLYFLRSFAYAGIGVVVIAAISALVVAPALLAVLGHRVNAGRLPWSRAARGAASAWWGRVAGVVMRRPGRTALPVVGLLVLLAVPLFGARFGTPDPGVLRANAPSRVVADTLSTRFPGNASAPIDVVSDGPVNAGALSGYATQLSELRGVVSVVSSTGTYASGSRTGDGDPSLGRPDGQRITIISADQPKSAAAQDLVRAVRDAPAPAGVTTLVGGQDAELIDTVHAIGTRLPLAMAMIAFTTFVVLFLFTGSVVQPIRALVLGSLSLVATLGALTWMFQDGHLAGVFDFTARPMDMAMTVLLFCITFGLSMDYEVFVVSRIKELHDRGAAPSIAVPEGLARTGRIVSTAAGLLAVSFFAFATGTVSFLQMFGIGCGLAILLDATLVRGVLVPAAMRVLGRMAWYSPPPLRRLYARIGLAEA
ncbi:MAG TPA: MMPL family transporter [Micromonosporaceae bacterium]|nr:MMPL family transporter [Micromonosporaceae bacterium]